LRQQVVNTTETATQAQLTKLTARLNASLAGQASDEARRHYDAAPLGVEKELLGRVIAVLDLYEKGSESLVVHDGVRNLLRQPEFAESSRLHPVLEVLEETRYLTLLLRQLIGESDLQIVIGSENASTQLQGFAVVLTTYGPSDRLKRARGGIGRTRMAYSQTVALLEAMHNVLEHNPEGIDESWVKGLELSVRKLEEALGTHGLQPIDAVGAQFDPKLHEAVGHEESREPEDTVVSELRRGYRVRDRVVRPALVKVARPPAHSEDTESR